MKLKSAITLATFMMISQNILASEQTIATITTDSSNRTYKLVIDAEDGRKIQNFYKDVFENGQKIKRDILDAKELTRSGVILEKRDKYVIMKLKAINFDEEQGGIVTVDTLYNGATGERRSYELQIAQGSKGWSIFKQNKTINSIQIQTNRVIMIGEVGIKNLVMK